MNDNDDIICGIIEKLSLKQSFIGYRPAIICDIQFPGDVVSPRIYSNGGALASPSGGLYEGVPSAIGGADVVENKMAARQTSEEDETSEQTHDVELNCSGTSVQLLRLKSKPYVFVFPFFL